MNTSPPALAPTYIPARHLHLPKTPSSSPAPRQVSKDEYYKQMERQRQEQREALPAGGEAEGEGEGAPKRSLKEKYDQF